MLPPRRMSTTSRPGSAWPPGRSRLAYSYPAPFVSRARANLSSMPVPVTAFSTLRKSQCEVGIEHPVGLDPRVLNVPLEIPELVVGDIRRSHGDETVPPRKAVADGWID